MKTTILLISLQKDLEVIGLKYLHYYLLKHSYNSTLLFLPNFKPHDNNNLKCIQKFVLKNSPKLIGMSVMSIEYANACHLTRYLKDCFKSLPIVWGGIHPTIAPDMCLKYADYVCIGEGERTILDLAHSIHNGNNDLAQIKNLCYKECGQIKRNPLYPLIDDLDDIPSYDHIPVNSYIHDHGKMLPLDQNIFKKYVRYSGITYSIMSSRGCPFSCTYCCNNVISRLYGTKKIRRRSIPNIIAEIEKAITDNPYIEYINFQDDCFLACSHEYLNEFCERYKELIKKPFIIRSIPIYVTREKLKILKSAGLAWISLGLQSGSDRVCKEIYKRKSLKADFLKAVKTVKDYNIAPVYDVILDNPFETKEDKLETIQTLIKTPKPYYIQFFSLTLYLGTGLYEKTKKEFPEHIEGFLKKDYNLYTKDILNDMIRIAAFLREKQVNRILQLYKKDPASPNLRLRLLVAKLESALIFEPLTYFRVLRLSLGEDSLKMLKMLPHTFKSGFKRMIIQYFNQFK